MTLMIKSDPRTDQEIREEDEDRTGRPRCIGCGKFLKISASWNQCADCDTRSYDY